MAGSHHRRGARPTGRPGNTLGNTLADQTAEDTPVRWTACIPVGLHLSSMAAQVSGLLQSSSPLDMTTWPDLVKH